jgi:amino acid permease
VLLLILIKTSIKKIAKEVSGDASMEDSILLNYCIVPFTGFLLFPFAMIRKIQNLKFYSFAGFVGIMLFVIFLVITAVMKVA